MSSIDFLIDALNDGFENSKSAIQLEQELRLEVGRTQEPTRNLIRSAIINHDIPIGSRRSGYYLIDDEAELNEAISGLQRRIDGLQNRINSLKSGWRQRQESRENGGNWPKSI